MEKLSANDETSGYIKETDGEGRERLGDSGTVVDDGERENGSRRPNNMPMPTQPISWGPCTCRGDCMGEPVGSYCR